MNKRILLAIALSVWQAALILLAVVVIPMFANWWGDYFGWRSAFIVAGAFAVFSAILITWWVWLWGRKETK